MSRAILLNFIFVALVRTCTGDALDDSINAKLTELKIVGASVAVYKKSSYDAPITRGYGNTKATGGTKVCSDTVFLIASMSKVFTGCAASVLIDKGSISLDDDIKGALPSTWAASTYRNPAFPNTKVTWRSLLTHRSSMVGSAPGPDDDTELTYAPEGGYGGQAKGNPSCPLSDLKGFYRDLLTDKDTETNVGATYTPSEGGALNWYDLAERNGGCWLQGAPGSEVKYSNLATGYLGALIEFSSGKSFTKFTKEMIFDKLGMTSTAWFRSDLPNGVTEACPMKYDPNSGDYTDIGHYCFIDYPSGQLRTNAKNMAKFGLSMLNYGAPTLWSKTTGESAFACTELDDKGSKPETCEFGILWVRKEDADKADVEQGDFLEAVKDLDWTDLVAHSGAEEGAQTQILVMPGAGLFAVVLTNTNGNDGMAAQKLMHTLLTNMPDNWSSSPAPSPSPSAPSPTGTFTAASGALELYRFWQPFLMFYGFIVSGI